MHASIAIFVMLVGGPVNPEIEITVLPLKDDPSSQTSIQDLEWKERVKQHPLPHVPTLDDRQQTADDSGRNGYRPYPPTGTQPVRPPVMPAPPTDAGPVGNGYGPSGNYGYGQAGSGGGGNYGPNGGYGGGPPPYGNPGASLSMADTGADTIIPWLMPRQSPRRQRLTILTPITRYPPTRIGMG